MSSHKHFFCFSFGGITGKVRANSSITRRKRLGMTEFSSSVSRLVGSHRQRSCEFKPFLQKSSGHDRVLIFADDKNRLDHPYWDTDFTDMKVFVET
jgi:hypothetical protein